MGRTSDRFGHRSHPLFSHAKELVTAAVHAAASGDAGALAPLLDAKMDTLVAFEFEEVMSMAYLELRQRRGAEQALRMLVSTTQKVSEEFQRSSDAMTVSLFGLVLEFPFAANAVQLSQDQANAIVRALVQHRLLSDQGQVTLLPRLLSVRQTNGLRAGSVYELSRALGRGDMAAAMALFGDVPSETDEGKVAHLRTMEYVAVVVGIVGVNSSVAYPLPAELAAQLQPTESPELQPLGYTFASQQMLEELHQKLATFCADLSPALSLDSARAQQPAGASGQVRTHAVNLKRRAAALAILTRLAREHGNGQLASLVVGRPATAGGDGFVAPIHRHADGKHVGAFPWPQARFEPPLDALLHLLTFLQDQQLLVESSPPRTGLLH